MKINDGKLISAINVRVGDHIHVGGPKVNKWDTVRETQVHINATGMTIILRGYDDMYYAKPGMNVIISKINETANSMDCWC